MAGLLDGIDPQTALLLGLSSGLLGTTGQGRRATFGEALSAGIQGGMGGYRQAMQDQQRAEQMRQAQALQAAQLKMQQEQATREAQAFAMKAEAARRAQEQEDQQRAMAARFAKQAPQMALEAGAAAGSVGPTNANADRLAAAPGASGYDFAGYADALAGVDPMRALALKQALQKETPAGVVVPEGAMLADPRTGKQLVANPKQEKQDPLQWVDAGDAQIGFDRSGREVARVAKGTNPAQAPKPNDVPASVVTAFNENKAAMGKIDRALSLLGTTGGSLGMQNYLGDAIMQRVDPGGVELRSIIADIGSLKIHDRSGAAVSAAEFPRLKPFIPAATDTPDTVRKKLMQFRSEYESMQRDMADAYSPGNNYRPMLGPAPGPASPGAKPAQGSKVATEADIAHTLRANPGITRQQLMQRLESAGYTINDRMYRPSGGASGGF